MVNWLRISRLKLIIRGFIDSNKGYGESINKQKVLEYKLINKRPV